VAEASSCWLHVVLVRAVEPDPKSKQFRLLEVESKIFLMVEPEPDIFVPVQAS